MTSVPPQFTYNQLQTKAFYSVFKQWPIQPISNGGQYVPGEVVRIFLSGLNKSAVMDPYKSHLQITVSCDQSTLPVGLLQLDNSAQSFIQQLVISSRNRQVQRIIQYSCLAAYLSDVGISQIYAQGKEYQGLGFSNIQTNQSIYSNTVTSGNMAVVNSQPNQFQSSGNPKGAYAPGTLNPTIPTRFAYKGSSGFSQFPIGCLTGSFRTHMSWLNLAWQNNLIEVWYWYQALNADPTQPYCTDPARGVSVNTWGYCQNMRAQYLAKINSNDYVDSNTSFSAYQIILDAKVQNGTFPAKFQNGTVYTVHPNQTIQYYDCDNLYDQATATWIPTVNATFKCASIPPLVGYTNLYSPNFSKGGNQPFISPTVPQCQMQNGLILAQKIPISRRTFIIPLVSCTIGTLMPKSQFVLLPLEAIQGGQIQLTIDQHAMFTSGYNDIGQFDNIGMGLMQQRAFKVERIVYNLHTYQFYSPQMDQYLRLNLNSGIAVNAHMWQLGNQYQIQNAQSLTNSWPVACNQEALNEILVLFYPLDYQNFTFCRKHFRLSNCITKMQLRINMEYYPSQPLSGNGGNPIQLDSSGNNNVFLNQIYMSNGYFFQKQLSIPRINPYNFAINDRLYNIYNTHTYYDPAMINNKTYIWGQTTINADTALGMSLIHQNRYIGKAAYLFSFEPYAHSKNFLTGIDCRSTKQFDIIFSCNPDTFFPRAQSMLIYTRSSVIIQYSRDGITNINK